MIQIRSFILLFIFIALSATSIFADTIILKAENSPYYIYNDTVFPKGDDLRIEAGVELFIANDVTVHIYSNLHIEGSPDAPVYIKPIDDQKGWKEFFLYKGADSLVMKHVIVENGRFRVYKRNVIYDHVEFTNSQKLDWNHAISRFFGGTLSITNTSIQGINKGEGFLCHDINHIKVYNCDFDNIPDAVEFINCTDGMIRKSQFKDMRDDAIDLNHCSNIIIDSNVIFNVRDRGMEIGSEHFGSSHNILVSKNIVYNCKEGINFKEASSGQIVQNTLYNNKTAIAVIQPIDTKFSGSDVEINSNLFIDNEANVFVDDSSSAIISYCLYEGGELEGDYHINSKPFVFDKASHHFMLKSTSPCINSGDPNLLQEPDFTRADIGAHYYNLIDWHEYNDRYKDPNEIWPILVQDELLIETDHEIKEIEIYNVKGIYKTKPSINENMLDLQEFDPGVYIVVIEQKGGEKQYYKFLKQ